MSEQGSTAIAGGQQASLDLTRYKTKELQQRFQQLFGVAHLLPWAALGLCACSGTALVTWAVLFAPRATLFIAVLTLIYMGLQGFFLGIAAASLLVVTRIFQQLTAIVDITIQTLIQALRDVRHLDDPGVRAGLSGALIHGAIMPTVKSAIAVKVGLLRLPISFFVNRLLNKTARKMTKYIEKKAMPNLTDQDSDAEVEVVSQNSQDLVKNPDESHLDRMHDRIDVIARRTRRATLIPATLLFFSAAAISSIPWIVAFLLLV